MLPLRIPCKQLGRRSVDNNNGNVVKMYLRRRAFMLNAFFKDFHLAAGGKELGDEG